MLSNCTYQHKYNLASTEPSKFLDEEALEHIHPLYRPKNVLRKSHRKKDKGKQLSYASSGENFYPFLDNMSSTSRKSLAYNLEDKLNILFQKVETNERNLAKLMKDKYTLESSTREKKIEKEIKDIFVFVKDQKLLQHKLNEDLHKQLKEVKDSIENINFQSHQVFLQRVPNLQKKIQNFSEHRQKMEVDFQKIKDELKTYQWKSFYEGIKSSSKICTSPIPISISERVQDMVVNEIIYYVDEHGYLLDSHFYYLVSEDNQPVKVAPPIDQKLKQCKQIHINT